MGGVAVGELRECIAEMYSDVARFPRAEFHFPTGRPLMERLGYSSGALDRVPPTAMESFAGVGYHFDFDPIRPGERVLDVGSGAGSDVFFAALSAGKGGSATGIDMTERMLEKARSSIDPEAFPHVDFVQGYIEELPFDDGSFDVVTSNGVINLSPDKPAVFAGIARVLRPGGRLMFSDIVTGVEVPASVRANCELWAECIGGAVKEASCVRLLEDAGFKVEAVRDNDRYAFTQESTLSAAAKFQVKSVAMHAIKL